MTSVDSLEKLARSMESGDKDAAVSCYTEGVVFEFRPEKALSTLGGKVTLQKSFDEMYGLPGIQFRFISKFSVGDWGAAEWAFSWMDPAKGGRQMIHGASIFRFKENKISHETIYYKPQAALA